MHQLPQLPSLPTEAFGGTFAWFSWDPYQWAAEILQGLTIQMVRLSVWMIVNAAEPHVLSDWFRGEYGVMLRLAMLVMIPIIFAATVGALLRGGLQQVLRTYLWALPIGIFGGVIVLALVELCIKVDADMTRMVFSDTTETMQGFYDAINNESDNPAESFGLQYWFAVQFLVMFGILICTVILWFEMFFRQVMIYMAVMFIPMSLAAFIWGPVRIWFYNLCELVVTMIWAKFIVAAVMAFGFKAMAYGFTGAGNASASDNPVFTSLAFGFRAMTYAATGIDVDATTSQVGVLIGGLVIMFIACWAGPVIVMFVVAPSHQILQRKEVQQLQPWNHDRKFAGQLFGSQVKGAAGGIGKLAGKAKGK